MDSFQLPKPERHYAKVINCIIDIFGVNYFRTVAHGQATSFSKKKQVLLKLTIFFILTNNHILTKWAWFSDSTSKIMVMLLWVLSLILLTPAIMEHSNFLHRKEVAQYLLKYKCQRLHQPHFGKFLLSSTNE